MTEVFVEKLGSRREFIIRGNCVADDVLADGTELRVFAVGTKGAVGFCTAMATLCPNATIPYHTHPCAEVITALHGVAVVEVEGRRYRLEAYDSIFIPADVAHSARNASSRDEAQLHIAYNDAAPETIEANGHWSPADLDRSNSTAPEKLVRFANAPCYQLAPDAIFRDLFARRLGSIGVCGGYGNFRPGASLPCHVHDYDESISIVEGEAICHVAGREYFLSNHDTACIPRGIPHRFINRSDKPMAMMWVYAGDEPDRVIVDQSCCRRGD